MKFFRDFFTEYEGKVVSLQSYFLIKIENMLLRIEIGNFLSFYNNVVFDMFPNPKREHLQSHILNQKVPLLKQAAI